MLVFCEKGSGRLDISCGCSAGSRCLNGEYTNILVVETQNDVVPSVVGEPWTEHMI